MKRSLIILLGLCLSLQTYTFAQVQEDLRISIPLRDWLISKGDFPLRKKIILTTLPGKSSHPHRFGQSMPFDKIHIQGLP
jgi:hypothetical protein